MKEGGIHWTRKLKHELVGKENKLGKAKSPNTDQCRICSKNPWMKGNELRIQGYMVVPKHSAKIKKVILC